MRGRYEKKTPPIWSIIFKIVSTVAEVITIIEFIDKHIEG